MGGVLALRSRALRLLHRRSTLTHAATLHRGACIGAHVMVVAADAAGLLALALALHGPRARLRVLGADRARRAAPRDAALAERVLCWRAATPGAYQPAAARLCFTSPCLQTTGAFAALRSASGLGAELNERRCDYDERTSSQHVQRTLSHIRPLWIPRPRSGRADQSPHSTVFSSRGTYEGMLWSS